MNIAASSFSIHAVELSNIAGHDIHTNHNLHDNRDIIVFMSLTLVIIQMFANVSATIRLPSSG